MRESGFSTARCVFATRQSLPAAYLFTIYGYHGWLRRNVSNVFDAADLAELASVGQLFTAYRIVGIKMV